MIFPCWMKFPNSVSGQATTLSKTGCSVDITQLYKVLQECAQR